MQELRLCSLTLAHAARRLAVNPHSAPEYPLGMARRRDGMVWLAGPPQSGQLPAATTERLRIVTEQEGADLPKISGISLALGRGPRAGHLSARLHSSAGNHPISEISLVGPGMPHLGHPAERVGRTFPADFAAERVWSRTIGALGAEGWSRLTDLRFAISGCGRLGSALAELLARCGIRELTLIDPDVMEPHNTGEMAGARLGDVGRSKVEALAEFLNRQAPRTTVTPVAASLLALPALTAVKRCDVLLSAPDSPTPRLAAALLATAYLMPLLDLGTGIFHQGAEVRGRQMGADVRLVLPGRCLLCFGGLRGLDRARQELLDQGPAEASSQPDVLPGGRSGSLASLNTLGVALAVRLIEDLALGRVEESRWLRLEFDDDGLPHLDVRSPERTPRCRLCRHAGHGDAALSAVSEVLRADP